MRDVPPVAARALGERPDAGDVGTGSDPEPVDADARVPEARQEIERMTGGRVYLDLWVKVRKGWRRDERELRRLGYDLRG